MIDISKKGVFIGFSSIPFQNQEKFVKKEIAERLFEPYRKGLYDYSGEKKPLNDDLYNPEVYYLWGKFDICILSDVDDWEFATREFSPRIDSVVSQSHGEMQNFDYRVILGLNPSEVKHGALPENMNALPYLSVTQLKLNSALLVGNGVNFLDRIKSNIENLVRNFEYQEGQILRVNILESFSYHELIIIAKSNSIKLLRKIVVAIRNLKFSQASNDSGKRRDMLERSLLQFMAKTEQGGGHALKPEQVDNHIFESTFTSFGFHFDFYNNKSEYANKVIKPISNEKITFFSRWNIKPGHTQKVKEIIEKIEAAKESSKLDEKFLIAGKGDLLVKKVVTVPEDFNTFEFPEYYFRQNVDIASHRGDDSLRKHVRETYTTVGFELESESEFDNQYHFDFHACLQNYTVKNPVFDKLKSQIKALWLPKPLAEKLLRIVANYNNAILSPDMFVFYIELEPHIKNCIINTVDLYFQNKGKDGYSVLRLIKILEAICSNLEMGYHNRFHQSYWTWEIPEVNTDYSGGIHNLISGYDSCYKSLNNICRDQESNNISFLNVRGNSRIRSSQDTLRMNFLYIIQPYIYSTIASHESLSFAIEKFCDDLFSKGELNENDNLLIRNLVTLYQQAQIEFNLPNLVYTVESDNNKGFDIFSVLKQLEDRVEYPRILNSITPETLRYLITDFMNLKVCFDGNFELFCEVRWNHFFQSGHVYDAPNKINDTYFLTMSFRLGLLMVIVQDLPRVTRNELRQIYMGKDLDVLKEHEEFFNADIRTVINALKSDNAFSSWFHNMKSILTNESIEFLTKKWINSDIVQYVEKLLSFPDRIDLDSFCEFIDSQVLEANNSKGVCDKKMSVFYLSTINAILKHYSTRFELLTRNSKDGMILSKKPGFFLDPCGGSFVTGRQNRGVYLQQRVIIYKLFYHLGQLHKFNYFSQNTTAGDNLFRKTNR